MQMLKRDLLSQEQQEMQEEMNKDPLLAQIAGMCTHGSVDLQQQTMS